MTYTYEQLAKMIDHSLLHPTMTDRELEDGCALAAKYQVASVCIKPYAVKRAAELLKGSGVFVGAVIGFLTGIVVSTGPITVPVFSAYGLVKGAFIATEAAGSLALYISKAATFHTFGALPGDIVVKGLITGSSVMAGTYCARLIVERLSIASFQYLLDIVMLVSGLTLLWSALRTLQFS